MKKKTSFVSETNTKKKTLCYYFYSFGSPAIFFKLMCWHVLLPHLILPVKTRIIFKSLNKVCKQTTFRNVKRDSGCRENTAIGVDVHLKCTRNSCSTI